jgi:starch synthase (maltosyl-transferring)
MNKALSLERQGRNRAIIEAVTPEVDCGRYPIKRTVGEPVLVEADVFTDGHDAVSADLLFRRQGERAWQTAAMQPLVNDRWQASFTVVELGRYEYTVRAWVDHFLTWQRELAKRIEAGQDLAIPLLVGANYLAEAASRAEGEAQERLLLASRQLSDPGDPATRAQQGLDLELRTLMRQYHEPALETWYPRELAVVVDPVKARFSAWYEYFPRSAAATPGAHGTFRDAEARLPYIAGMGFDVVYLPPIHPIGRLNRKGRNNALQAERGDPGSPWAIGSEEGGHKSVHPELGTLDDFKRFIRAAKKQGVEVAMDIAFQCAPDHPYVREHPEWFRQRPDGTIQFAENPPKKYEDIYPFDFESPAWQSLWEELKSVFLFWIEHGVTIFRVDNPHTKSLRFWAWAIPEIKREHPETIFLAEAFTRPKVMYHLAKLGFTQSYNYFPWRNHRWDLTEYFTELTQTQVREYFRPNLWPNTPDILTEFLQHGGRSATTLRFLLAATLGASYGIYGPAFELFEVRPRHAGSEEYLDSEKYQLRTWNTATDESLHDLIALVNRVRRENQALQYDHSLRFHATDNEEILCYSKTSLDKSNVILVVANLNPYYKHSTWVHLDMGALGLESAQAFQVHDLVSGARYLWHGPHNYVELDPHAMPAHVFRVRRRFQHENDFEYFE